MKRYLGFFGVNYYPAGGMEDFIDDSDSVEALVVSLNETLVKEGWEDWLFCWAQIYDTKERKIIWEYSDYIEKQNNK